jgi:hypothetical protein
MYESWYIDGDFVVCPQCKAYVVIDGREPYRVADILNTIDLHNREGHNK